MVSSAAFASTPVPGCKYPITEIFESVQGEGQWAGTCMTFIRLAGCSVGQAYTGPEKSMLNLAPYQYKCCTAEGKEFPCDTDYGVRFRMTAEELLEFPLVCAARRVCFTGGEPLMHPVQAIFRRLNTMAIDVHVETSGTIAATDTELTELSAYTSWLTVSPKWGVRESMLAVANEIKVLVGSGFDNYSFEQRYLRYANKVWLQPINGEHAIDRCNLETCIGLVRKYKTVRLSTQMHKVWGVR